MSAAVGIGSLVMAMRVPALVMGSLAHVSAPGAGVVGAAVQVGMMLAGLGLVGGAGAGLRAAIHPVGQALGAGTALGAGAGGATVTPVAPAVNGYVRSLLSGGGGPRLLPPPRD